jgi:hypothetical protein
MTDNHFLKPDNEALCIAKAYGGEWCIERCQDPKDCSAKPRRKLAEQKLGQEPEVR